MSVLLIFAYSQIRKLGFQKSEIYKHSSFRYLPVAKYEHQNEVQDVPTHVVTLTQVGTSVYLGQTHLGTPLQVPAWVRKFSLGSTGDDISSLIIIQSLFVQQKFEYQEAL